MRQYTLEVLPKFPARVDAGAGVRIDKANGVYTFGVDFDTVGSIGPPLPVGTLLLAQLPDGSYVTVEVTDVAASNFPTEVTGRKNAFINGMMQVRQRGIVAGVSTTRAYVVDRWAVKTGAGTLTANTIINNGLNTIFPRWGQLLRLQGNTGVTTVDLDQRIENVNPGGNPGQARPLYGPTSFQMWVRNNTGAAFTPRLFVECPTAPDNWAASTIVNGGGAGEALQSVPPDGNPFQLTWQADISTLGAAINNGIGFRVQFPSGSLDSSGKSIDVFHAQVERRPSLDGIYTVPELEDFPSELLRCQRYFQKSFPYGTTPAQSAGQLGALSFSQNVGAAAAMLGIAARLLTVMRTAPTLTFFNPSAANAFARNINVPADCSVTSANSIGDSAFAIVATTAAGSAVGQQNLMHFTADAEL